MQHEGQVGLSASSRYEVSYYYHYKESKKVLLLIAIFQLAKSKAKNASAREDENANTSLELTYNHYCLLPIIPFYLPNGVSPGGISAQTRRFPYQQNTSNLWRPL